MKRCLALLLTLSLLLSLGVAAFADDVLRLPAGTKAVEEEAFFGDASLDEVVLPEGIESIGKNAFAESSVKKINLPDSLKSIDNTALPAPGTVEVTAHAGSDAYAWAVEKGYISVGIPVDADSFPDEAFRRYVAENCDTNKDGMLDVAEIADVTAITITDFETASLDGIEFFPALTELTCAGYFDFQNYDAVFMPITALDLSHNPALTTLNCGYCRLETLDISKNTALTALTCSRCGIQSLDLSNNTALQVLDCGACMGLRSLDLSNNTALEALYCSACSISSLDLTNNTALRELYCGNDILFSVDVSHCPELSILNCAHSRWLTKLNIAGNPALTCLSCEGTHIIYLDISSCPNLITAYEQGEQGAIYGYNNYGNQVEYPSFTYEGDVTYTLTLGEKTEVYTTVSPGILAIDESNFPDPVFREKLLSSYDDNKDGFFSQLEIDYLDHADLNLYSGNPQIESLAGIEHFSSLRVLSCSDNALAELDLSNNTTLESVYCTENRLTNLIIGQNTVLTSLYCGNNSLTTLDVSGCPALKYLDCRGNQLTEIDIRSCPNCQVRCDEGVTIIK